jgi:hypothetical protein
MNEDPAASILTVQVPIQESHLEGQVRGDMAEALAVKAEGICVPTFVEFGEDCRQSGQSTDVAPRGQPPYLESYWDDCNPDLGNPKWRTETLYAVTLTNILIRDSPPVIGPFYMYFAVFRRPTKACK